MAKFEVDLPPVVADLVNKAPRTWGRAYEYAKAAMPVFEAHGAPYGGFGEPDLSNSEVIALARLFAAAGWLLDRHAGHKRGFVDVEERARRSARGKRAHATQLAAREAPAVSNVVLLSSRRIGGQ